VGFDVFRRAVKCTGHTRIGAGGTVITPNVNDYWRGLETEPGADCL
jgi:hypothetical protein